MELGMVIAGVVLAPMGLLFLVLAVWGMLRHGGELRRLLKCRPSTVANVQAGQATELAGRVVASEQGTIAAPIGGRQVIGYRIEIYDTGVDNGAELLHTAGEYREFLLRDDAGGDARIHPRDARKLHPLTRHGKTYDLAVKVVDLPRRNVPLTPEVLAWAQATAGTKTDALFIDEWQVAPGDRLHVFGLAERDPQGAVQLREHPGTSLWISSYDRAGVRKSFGRRKLTLAIFLVVGLVMSVAGAGLVRAGW
jgi:hypothetical protein